MRIFIIAVLLLIGASSRAQTKLDFIFGADVYQWYLNPVDPQVPESRSSAGQLLGLQTGLKFSGGGSRFGLAIECSGNFAPLAFDFPKFKGLGAASYQLIGKMNVGALTGFSKDQLFGFSLGAGLQYSRTELFGLTDAYAHLRRNWFKTYVGEIAIGGGLSRFLVMAYLRIGTSRQHAWTLQQGIQMSYRLL